MIRPHFLKYLYQSTALAQYTNVVVHWLPSRESKNRFARFSPSPLQPAGRGDAPAPRARRRVGEVGGDGLFVVCAFDVARFFFSAGLLEAPFRPVDGIKVREAAGGTGTRTGRLGGRPRDVLRCKVCMCKGGRGFVALCRGKDCDVEDERRYAVCACGCTATQIGQSGPPDDAGALSCGARISASPVPRCACSTILLRRLLRTAIPIASTYAVTVGLFEGTPPSSIRALGSLFYATKVFSPHLAHSFQ